ncbi:MAG: MFS transporter [Defluviitaleaceae bacterium]|nr:MFS transporter [Defluviitaleaceae bacterium]
MKDHYLLIFKLIMLVGAGSGGIFASFINLHLEQNVGLTGTQIGFVAFLSTGLVIVIKPVVGFIGDKTGEYGGVIKMALIVSIIASIFYYYARTFAAVMIVSLFIGLARGPITPFTDLIITNYCEKVKYDFGKIRVFVSWGWLLFTMIAGFLITGFHLPWVGGRIELSLPMVIFGTSVIMSALTFTLMFFVPKSEAGISEKKVKQKATKKDVKQLLANRQFLFILAFSMMSLIVVESAKMYIANHLVEELGAAESVMSWMMLAQVGPELILLPLGAVILRKVGFKKWYLFSVSTMILRLAVYSFTTNLTIFVLLSMGHAIAVCTQVAGNITYIRKVVPQNVMGLAFTLVASVSAVSSAVLNLLFGIIYQHMGGFMVFRITTVILIGTLVLVIRSKSLSEVGTAIIVEQVRLA